MPLDASQGLPQRHVWWYPTGPLTFIPIHAVGPFNKPTDVDVSRLVISWYTITLASLIRARKKTVLGPSKSLVRGQESLPRSSEETDRVLKIIRAAGGSGNSVWCLRGSAATVEKAPESLDSCAWVHFAYPGVQDLTSSTNGGVLPLGQTASKRLGQFAFPSLCHEAAGLESLPGEAMHLAVALQSVRISTVVATMWGIKDEDALSAYA